MTDTTPAATTASAQRLLPLLLILFIGSGCSALIYEIVWLQMLQLVIGSSAISLGVLLGTFMGGMCLGSLLLSRVISAQRHPLRVYAALELGIGLIAILVLYGMPVIAEFYTGVAGPGMSSVFLRAAVSVLCLLPPTMLMGATLPAISRWVQATPQGVSWLGFFYGGNIVGAVVGCLWAGLYLLPVHDMAHATFVAAAINCTVAAFAFLLATISIYLPASRATPESRGALLPVVVPGAAGVYITIALSGLSALGAEIVWTRLLSLMFGPTIYTFSLILAVFLLGLGIGSTVGAHLARTVLHPRAALGYCQLLLVVAVTWTAWAISSSLPNWPIDLEISRGQRFVFEMDLVRCMWAVLPAAILWGASFPLALAGVAARGKDPGRVVGGVYAANTVGAIVGALAFSMFLIPEWGTKVCEQSLIFIAGVSALIALVPLLFERRPETPGIAGPSQPSIGLVVVLLAAVATMPWFASTVEALPWGVVAFGRQAPTWYHLLNPEIVKEEDVPRTPNGEINRYCTFVGEGMNVSVAVTYSTDGYRYFHGAGKVQASSDPYDMRLQRMLGHISALVQKNPENVLVVACGAGVTAGSFVPYDSVKRIVICDIEPLVPKMVAPMFKKENYNVVGDPRTQVVIDDGRHFIRTTKEKFDIITSDPIDPWVKGCAALNTKEYYEMCKQHLKPGGVMALWIPLYESDEATSRSVIGTFFEVFPNGILWSNDQNGGGYDAVLFAQVEPTKINLDDMAAFLDSHPKVKASLENVGFGSRRGPGMENLDVAADLCSTFAGQASSLKDWTANAQINTDSNLRLQYLAGWSLNSYLSVQIFSNILSHFKFPSDIFTGSREHMEALKAAMESIGRREPVKVLLQDAVPNPNASIRVIRPPDDTAPAAAATAVSPPAANSPPVK